MALTTIQTALSADAESKQEEEENGQANNNTFLRVEEILIKGGAVFATQKLPNSCSVYTGTPNDGNDNDKSLGERLHSGATILTIYNLLTTPEIAYLLESSLAAAEVYEVNPDTNKGHLYTRMSTPAAAKREGDREQDTATLPEAISQKIDDIIERIVRLVEEQLCSSVKATLFGLSQSAEEENEPQGNSSNSNLLELLYNNQLLFSKREPAVNVYKAPFGHIGMHKDNHDLTILIPLSDPVQDFTGGGTAFWSQKFPQEGLHDPSLKLRPPPGTIVLFGGRVSHSGLHLRSGTRVAIVCSFSRPLKKDSNQKNDLQLVR